MQGRQVLLAGDNFGAGSSREHAPWALTSWGIRAILSTSFADIFRSNALKNGLLPIVVDEDTHRALFECFADSPDDEVTVDLEAQLVHLPGDQDIPFEVDPFARQMLLRGHGRDRLAARSQQRHRRLGSRPPRPHRHPTHRRRLSAAPPGDRRHAPALRPAERRRQAPLCHPDRRPRPRRRASHAQGHGLHRRGPGQAHHRRGHDLDRDDALQPQPAPAGGVREGRHPGRRRDARWSSTPSPSATAWPWAPRA